MTPADPLRFLVHDLIDGVEVGPSHVPLALLGEFQRDVAEFLRGASRDVDLSQVHISIEPGSLALAVSGLPSTATLWVDIAYLSSPNAMSLVDPKRAAVLGRWLLAARENPHRSYGLADANGRLFFIVNSKSDLVKVDDVWMQVEKYLHGKIVDMGGKTKANVHLELDDGQTLTVATSQELLAKDERNRLYRFALLHVTAEENLKTGSLRNVRLLSFDTHQPEYDDDEFQRMVRRGTQAWQDIGSATDWVDALRDGRI